MSNASAEPHSSGCEAPDSPVMPDDNLQEVGAQLHEVLDEVLTEATAGWAELACELAKALKEAAPEHELFMRDDVQRLLHRWPDDY